VTEKRVTAPAVVIDAGTAASRGNGFPEAAASHDGNTSFPFHFGLLSML